jgi:hypothetical protein
VGLVYQEEHGEMSTASTQDLNRGGAALHPVGELLYRFEADLELTPIGLVREGSR